MNFFVNPNLHNIYYALSWTFLHSFWQAAIITIAASIGMLFCAKFDARLKYRIWIAAMMFFVITSISTFGWYYNMQSHQVGQLSYAPFKDEVSPYASTGLPDVMEDVNTEIKQKSLRDSSGYFSYFNSFINRNMYMIILFWFIGLTMLILRFLGGLTYIQYLKNKANYKVDSNWENMVIQLKNKLSINKSIQLKESSLVQTILAVGHLKPLVLFPIGWLNNLDVQEVEAILAHELAHIKRNDYLVNIIQSMIEMIFYFNPIIWWLSARIREERENCCDDIAIEACGNSMRYAKSLVHVQELQGSYPQAAMAMLGSNKFQLLNRIKRLFEPKHYSNTLYEKFSVVGVIFLFVCVAFLQNISIANASDIKEETMGIHGDHSDHWNPGYSSLDSFLLNQKVPDGTYEYNDLGLNAKIEVKQNRVFALSFNGAELKPEEFPKFENFFYKMISEHYDHKNIDQANKTGINNKNSISNSTSTKSASTTVTNMNDGTTIIESTDDKGNVSRSIINTTSDNIKDKSSSNSNKGSKGKGTTISNDGNFVSMQSNKNAELKIFNDDKGNAIVQEWKNGKLIRETVNGRDKNGKEVNFKGSYTLTDGNVNINDDEGQIQKDNWIEELDDVKTDVDSDLTNPSEESKRLKKLLLSKIEYQKSRIAKIDHELSEKEACRISKEICALKQEIEAEIDMLDTNEEESNSKSSFSYSNRDDKGSSAHEDDRSADADDNVMDENWKSELKAALIKMKYLNSEFESFRLVWQKSNMYINGQKITKEQYIKLKDLYIKVHHMKGFNDKGFSYYWNETN